MKNNLIYIASIALLSFLSSCTSDDNDPVSPSIGSEPGFISSISQSWIDTAGTKSYFFGPADSLGRFTGNENDNSGNQNSLSGKTYRFDISFTVIKDQFTNYVDYAGKLTDTLSSHRRMVLYSNVDTLYLRPQ